MKYLTIIALVLFQLSNCIGQIKISSKVIPWKTLNNLDSLKVILQTPNNEIFRSTFSVDQFNHIDGEYPRTIFEFNLDESIRNLRFEVSYKYKANSRGASDQFSNIEVINVLINNREERIELEIHFQKYYDDEFNLTSKERIVRLVAKKIYHLPKEIKLIRNWEPFVSIHPKYFIQNNSSFKLYGVSGDGKFEGELFRMYSDSILQVYTGGYDYSQKPSKQLYRDNYVVSSIRDHREIDNRFRIKESGNYIYRVYLGFYPYEHDKRYGGTTTYSVTQKNCPSQHKKH